MESIQIQLSNATNPVTMDIIILDSGLTKIIQSEHESSNFRCFEFETIFPQVPNATGPEGNSKIELIRSESSPFNILLEDQSNYEDTFLGMNGRIAIDPSQIPLNSLAE